MSTGQERERVVQDERAAARKRVQAAQDVDAEKRVEQREHQQQVGDRARERARERRRAVADAADDAAADTAVSAPLEREREGDSSIRPDSTQQKGVTRPRSKWFVRASVLAC